MRKIFRIKTFYLLSLAILLYGLVVPFYGLFLSKSLDIIGVTGYRIKIYDEHTDPLTTHFDPIVQASSTFSYLLVFFAIILVLMTAYAFSFKKLFLKNSQDSQTKPMFSLVKILAIALYTLAIGTVMFFVALFACVFIGLGPLLSIGQFVEYLQYQMTWSPVETLIPAKCHDSFYNPCGADYSPSILQQLFMWAV